MTNIFSLKKRKKVSLFEKATLILEYNRGKGMPKRILFDRNAVDALGLGEEVKIGFIFDKNSFLLVLSKETEEEGLFTLPSSDSFSIIAAKDTFRLKAINSRDLWERMGDNWELDEDEDHIFNLTLIHKNDLPENIKEFVNEYKATIICVIDHISSLPQYQLHEQKYSIEIEKIDANGNLILAPTFSMKYSAKSLDNFEEVYRKIVDKGVIVNKEEALEAGKEVDFFDSPSKSNTIRTKV